jgi:hypothetical protein
VNPEKVCQNKRILYPRPAPFHTDYDEAMAFTVKQFVLSTLTRMLPSEDTVVEFECVRVQSHTGLCMTLLVILCRVAIGGPKSLEYMHLFTIVTCLQIW